MLSPPFDRSRCARGLNSLRGEFRTQQEEETACARATRARNGGKRKEKKKEKVRGKENGTWRKYLIGGTVTVHLAVTSGIPLPVCGETLQGSFTFSHRFSKMAHLTSRPNILSSVCLSLSLVLSSKKKSRRVAIPLRFERGERLFDTRRTTLDFR